MRQRRVNDFILDALRHVKPMEIVMHPMEADGFFQATIVYCSVVLSFFCSWANDRAYFSSKHKRLAFIPHVIR